MRTFVTVFCCIFVVIPMLVIALSKIPIIRETYLVAELGFVVVLIVFLGVLLKKRR